MDYRFKVIEFENYDGDSFNLTLDLGFDIRGYFRCRIHGVDTPELRGGTDESKKAGKIAKDFAHIFVQTGMHFKQDVVFVSQQYRGKFGRPLGDIEVRGQSLVRTLLANHYGVPYHGQNKSDVQAAHDANLEILRERGELEGKTS